MPIKVSELPLLLNVNSTDILPIVDVGGDAPISKKTTVASLATQVLTGNSASSTKLVTARTINGVAFDGTQNITITSPAIIPIATHSILGGIKIGAGVDIDGSGVISVTNISGNAGTVTNGVYTDVNYSDPIWLTISKSKVGLGNATNESKATMFSSPTFTGTPLSPTASAGTNTTQIATTAFVQTAVSSLVNSAPTTLDTLKELADALGSDANFSTTISTALGLKAPLASPTFTGTVSGITAAMVGLGNVTNESKATMFTSPAFTGTPTGITATHVGLGNVTNESKATMFTSPAFTGTVSGVTKSMVGLGNADNTADANKNVLYATTAGGAPATDVYAWAKASTKPTYTKSDVGLGNVTNESKATMFTSPAFTGTPTGITAAHVGLGNVTNESKATMFNNPVFTGTITGSVGGLTISPTAVGLENVTNESKATMFTSPAFTGTPVAPTATAGTNTTQLATTAFVSTAVSNLVDSAPAALNTLNELATALGNDANFATSVSTAIGLKAPIASPTFTGTVSGITATMVGLGNVTNESKSTMFSSPAFTGTPTGITATHVGLGNVTNESKATMFSSPAFTGTVNGVTAAMVGLGNVTNESKATMFSSPIFTGNASFSSYTSIKSLLETATVTATTGGPAATTNFDVITQGVQYYTANSANAFVLNVRGNNSTTLASMLAAGKSVSIGVLVTCSNAAHYMTAINIDGTATGVTTKWQGGATPAAGNASSIDVYTLTIIKTAETPAYTVLGTLTKFA